MRDAFGTSWADTDHNGCNQRDDVLLRDSVPGTTTVAQQGSCDHDVLAGTWHDPYTGSTLRFTDLKDLSQAEAIQIDHVVPLAEAWVSGAAGWNDDRREAFANDLHELLAVDGPTNLSKGDGDPAAWRPRKGYQCRLRQALDRDQDLLAPRGRPVGGRRAAADARLLPLSRRESVRSCPGRSPGRLWTTSTRWAVSTCRCGARRTPVCCPTPTWPASTRRSGRGSGASGSGARRPVSWWLARDEDGIVGLTTSGPARDDDRPAALELYAINVLRRAMARAGQTT